MKVAVLDIGSNSVRLMLWADGKTLYKRLKSTRLGEGIALCPVLRQEAIGRTVSAVVEFYRTAQSDGAERFYAFATAAVRSAKNGGEFVACVKEACGVSVDVLSGEEEAFLALDGALGGADGTVIDVGGASTEVCVRQGGAPVCSVSMDIGAVRLKDLCGEDKSLLREEIDRALCGLAGIKPCLPAVAVGGTATTLAAVKLGLKEYDTNVVQNVRMSTREIALLSDRLFSLSPEERKSLAGMDVRRTDVIAGASMLLLRLAERLGLTEIFVSDRDNLEGYLFRRVFQ